MSTTTNLASTEADENAIRDLVALAQAQIEQARDACGREVDVRARR